MIKIGTEGWHTRYYYHLFNTTDGKDIKNFKFISPYDDQFSNTHDKEVKELILKAKYIKLMLYYL